MTRRDILQTAHEPFGDAFYYGPERLSKRFENDEDARIKSGFAESTYRTVMDRLENDGSQEVRSNPSPNSLPFLLLPRIESSSSLRHARARIASVLQLRSLQRLAMQAHRC